MAIVTAVRDLAVMDLTALAPHLHVPVAELMGGDYRRTQALAALVSKHADGLEYLSRTTLRGILVPGHIGVRTFHHQSRQTADRFSA